MKSVIGYIVPESLTMTNRFGLRKGAHPFAQFVDQQIVAGKAELVAKSPFAYAFRVKD